MKKRRLSALFSSLAIAGLAVLGGPDLIHDSRPLTDSEIAFSKTIFGDEINYQDVRVVQIPQYSPYNLFVDVSAFVAPSIYHQIGFIGESEYCEDYLSKDCHIDETALFAHEMTHVWQRENSTLKFFSRVFDGEYSYEFEEGRTFASYGVEQQAELIEDYVANYAVYSFKEDDCRSYYFIEPQNPLLSKVVEDHYDSAESAYGGFIKSFIPDVANGPRGFTEGERNLLASIFGDEVDVGAIELRPAPEGNRNSSHSTKFDVKICGEYVDCGDNDTDALITIGSEYWQDDYTATSNESHLRRFMQAASLIAEGRSTCSFRGCDNHQYISASHIQDEEKGMRFEGFPPLVQGQLLTVYANRHFFNNEALSCAQTIYNYADDYDPELFERRAIELVNERFPNARPLEITINPN